MWLLVGLGNPGAKYQHHRHNIGFMAVEAIARRHNFSGWKKKFQSEICEGELDGEKVMLMKPQTFMNLSGQAVQEAAHFYKIDTGRIIVFHDELDLAPGKVRVKRGGGAAGHNGLRSMDDRMRPDYWRVRLGIGHPGDRDMVGGYVLSDFLKDDAAWLDALLNAIAREAEHLVFLEIDPFMSKVSASVQEVEERKKKAGEEAEKK